MRINNKNTDDALDILFAKARKEQNPLNNAEINKLLLDKKVSGIKQFFNLKTIFMTSSVLLTFTLLLYFLNHDSKRVTNNDLNINNINNEKQFVISESKNENFGFENSLINTDSQYNRRLTYIETQKNTSASLPFIAKDQIDLGGDKDLNTNESEDIKSITPANTILLELPEELLNKMNITFTKDGICFGSKNDIFMCYNSRGTNLSIKDDFDKEAVNKRISPVLITDAEGKHWRSTNFNEEIDKEFKLAYPDLLNDNNALYNKSLKEKYSLEYPDLQNNINEAYNKHLREFINAQVNSFIPVLVRLPEKYKGNEIKTGTDWGHDLIIWFKPTEAFLSVLDDTTRTRIVKEYLKSDNLPYKQKVENTSGIVNQALSLYPNPVIDKATVNFQLDKDKKVNIALHDVSGKLVKVFVRNEIRNAGNNTMTIDLKDLIQGIYILSLETADGNILTQRIIKQ